MLGSALASVEAVAEEKPRLKVGAVVNGDKNRWSGSVSGAAGQYANYAGVTMYRRVTEEPQDAVKSAVRAIEDNELTPDQVISARRHLRSSPRRHDASMVLVGTPPEPLTLAERWRDSDAIPAMRCDSDCCVRSVTTGYVCVDDYDAHTVVCNPRLAFQADASECAVYTPSTVVDDADTIVRHFDATAMQIPTTGQSDVYFTHSLPVAPRHSAE